jgi:hypothetical protein
MRAARNFTQVIDLLEHEPNLYIALGTPGFAWFPERGATVAVSSMSHVSRAGRPSSNAGTVNP